MQDQDGRRATECRYEVDVEGPMEGRPFFSIQNTDMVTRRASGSPWFWTLVLIAQCTSGPETELEARYPVVVLPIVTSGVNPDS